MIDIGVAGFRVDAAKHFGSEDLQAVVDMLHPVNGQPPVIMSEVIGGGSVNQPFVDWGSKAWAWDMPDLLAGSLSIGNMAFGKDLRWTQSYNGSSDTITMVGNHDTEHHGPTSIAYWQGNLYQLAHIYMLSIPFGIPEVYTGYSFSDENSGPNIDRNGMVTPMTCPKIDYKPQSIRADGIFTCVQRWRAIQGMIKWRDAAAQAPMRNVTYTKFTKAKALAYNRGSNWIVMNPTLAAQRVTYSTKMPKGTYCDVISGGRSSVRSNKTCVGTTVVVGSTGLATLTVPAQSAIAIGSFSKAK
jgi:alpha-amylase